MLSPGCQLSGWRGALCTLAPATAVSLRQPAAVADCLIDTAQAHSSCCCRSRQAGSWSRPRIGGEGLQAACSGTPAASCEGGRLCTPDCVQRGRVLHLKQPLAAPEAATRGMSSHPAAVAISRAPLCSDAPARHRTRPETAWGGGSRSTMDAGILDAGDWGAGVAVYSGRAWGQEECSAPWIVMPMLASRVLHGRGPSRLVPERTL